MKRSLLKVNSMEDILIDSFVYIICAIIMFVTIYPFYYILVISFNEGVDATLGGIYWLPRKLTFENYEKFFSDIKWLMGLGVTVLRTLIGSVVSVLFTTLVAYGLSFKELKYRKLYMLIIIVSMYFSGGIIPYYMLLKQLTLIDKFSVYIIPGALNIFFILVGLSFFADIPPSLRESAKIDGAGEFKVFRKIILPISMPFIATCLLFIGVGHWNNWFDSAFFIRNKNLRTLSYLMMEVINSTQVSAQTQQFGGGKQTITTLSVQAAAMMVATLPIICVYPFLQRYFVTGIMIGSVKE